MGKMGSGKGFAAKYLARKYGYRVIVMGNFVRTLARKEHLKPTRENLEKLQKKYSSIYKHDYVIEKAIEKAILIKSPVILDGIRKPIQAKLAKQKLKAVLIDIDAKPRIRFERMKSRRRADFPKTLDEFRKIEAKEEKVFSINKALKQADYVIDNDDGKPKLYRDIDSLMRRINQR